MKARFVLSSVCLFLFGGFTMSPTLVKYYLISKGDRGYGYGRIQSVLHLNYDSTFVEAVSFLRKKKSVIEIIDNEIYDGRWSINMDTLILEFNPIDSIELSQRKYLIGKRRIYYLPERDIVRERIYPKRYPWKFLVGKPLDVSIQAKGFEILFEHIEDGRIKYSKSLIVRKGVIND